MFTYKHERANIRVSEALSYSGRIFRPLLQYITSPREDLCFRIWPNMQCFSAAELFITRDNESDVNLAHDEARS